MAGWGQGRPPRKLLSGHELGQNGATMKDKIRLPLQMVAALLSLVIALSAALGMRDRVRLVDILALFAGGMGAGVTLVQIVRTVRERVSR